jgi:hypothetical protein
MEGRVKRYVAFSGGADSTALALLEPNAVPVFTDTGWEFPELYAHIERFERVTGRKVERPQGESLPDIIRRQKYLPNHGARFCTRMAKIEPLNRYLSGRLPAELLIGLRIDEPERAGNNTQMDGLTIRYPLRERGMTRADVLRVCIENDLLPRYPVYMARGGCTGCFYKRKSEVQAMVQLVPDVVDELQALEEAVQDERGAYFHMFPAIGMSIAELRKQPPLFDMTELYRDAANTSDIGDNCGLFCHR